MRNPDSYGRLPVAAAAFCLFLGAAAGAHAKAVARSFDELRLKVAPSAIVLDAERGHRTFTERDVQRSASGRRTRSGRAG
jgi:hypothetical protein